MLDRTIVLSACAVELREMMERPGHHERVTQLLEYVVGLLDVLIRFEVVVISIPMSLREQEISYSPQMQKVIVL